MTSSAKRPTRPVTHPPGPSAARSLAVLAAAAIVVLLLLPAGLGSSTPQGLARSFGPAGTHGAAAMAATPHATGPGNAPGALAAPAMSRPAAGPNASYSLEMAYDAADGYVVAVAPNVTGGLYNATYGPSDVTWMFSGGNWSVMNTTGAPPELLWPALTYDAADGYVVLFGGLVIAGSQGQVTAMVYSNQTWSYSAGVWTNRTSVTTVQPPADEPPVMTYDAADGYVVLLDEAVTAPQTMWPTTWAYRGGNWTNVTGPATRPAPPDSGVMAYDAVDGYVVYFGGLTSGPGIENWTTIPATWEFSAGTWTNVTATTNGAPSGRIFSAIAYDPARSEVVLFGGTAWNGPGTYNLPNDTWAYAGGNWTNLNVTTPALSWYTLDMVYDGAGHQLVLAGYTNNSRSAAVASSVWLLGTGSWTAAAPVLFLATVGADVGTPFELTVVLGPHAGTLSYQYAGLPTGCASANTPTLRCTAELPGRYHVHVTVTDALGLPVNLSTVVSVNPAPEVISFTSDLPVAEVGFPVDLAAVAIGGTGGLSYAYSGLPLGCASADSTTLSCTPASPGAAEISVVATDALGVTSALHFALPVAPRPSVTTFLVEPSVVDVGQTVVLAALTSGGVGPVAFQYRGLPEGCASADVLSFACAPTAPGAYLLSFEATDSFGSRAAGTATLTVNPAVAIANFDASARQVEVGQTLAFTVAPTGGTAPFVFVFSGLPGGCSTTDASTVQCVAAVPGNYTVTARVTDATGSSVSQAVVVTVDQIPRSTVGHPILPAGSLPGPLGSMFWWGVGIGSVGLLASALWARRQLRVRREGESIVRRLRSPERPVAAGDGDRSDPGEGTELRSG